MVGPNFRSIDQYFEVLYGETKGLIEIRAIHPENGKVIQTFFDKIPNAVAHCLRQRESFNVYNGIVTRREKGKGSKDGLRQVSALWVDLDFASLNGGEREACELLKSFPIPPSMLVHSGGGFHPYWLLKEPEEADDPPRIEGYLYGLARSLKADSAWDLSRILRPPETFNHPNAKKREAGRTKAPVRLESLNDRRYDLLDFGDFWEEPPTKAKPAELDEIPTEPPSHFITLLDRKPKLKATWEGRRKDLKDQSRSGICMALANLLVQEDFTDEEIAAVLIAKRPESNRDWLARTIGKARETVGRRAWVAEDVLCLVERQTEQGESLIERGLLPRKSIAFISGSAKRGKSVLVLNMAINLASGTPFLGQFPIPKPVKVLYINAEIAEESLQDRLKKMLAVNYPKPRKGHLFHLSRRDIRLDNNENVKRLARLIERHKPDVVILDPLTKFHDGDENSSGDMKLLLTGLDNLVQQFGISFVIIHHHGKPSADPKRRGAHLMRGSSTLFDFGDSYLTMNHWKDSDNLSRLTFELRNAPPIKPLIINRDDEVLWCVVEAEASHGAAKLTAIDVINALKAAGGEMMRKEFIESIMDRRGISLSTIERAIKEAEDRNLVQGVPTGGQGNPVKLVYKGNV